MRLVSFFNPYRFIALTISIPFVIVGFTMALYHGEISLWWIAGMIVAILIPSVYYALIIELTRKYSPLWKRLCIVSTAMMLPPALFAFSTATTTPRLLLALLGSLFIGTVIGVVTEEVFYLFSREKSEKM